MAGIGMSEVFMKKIVALLCIISCLGCYYDIPVLAIEQVQVEKSINISENKDNKGNNDFSNYIEITKNEIRLNSRLVRVYRGYKYTITSKYPDTLDLIM